MMHTNTSKSETSPSIPRVERLQFEHLREALGIGTAQPRLSWRTSSAASGWQQSAYEIEAHAPDGVLIASTGRIESAESVLVSWPFAPLTSRQHLAVQVRVWGSDGIASAWSAPVEVETGLLQPSDWSAQFIRPSWDEDTTQPQPSPLLRKEFKLEKSIRQARLYVTALGVYEASINGQRVGDHVMAPGWTSYHHRLRYQIFDVTGLLQPGANALGAMLGDGWFRGRLGFGGGRPNIYGERIALLAQLEIEFSDGSTQRVQTDSTWKAAKGPILVNDIYNGEDYDARQEQSGWDRAGFADQGWAAVKPVDWDLTTLFAPMGPPVRRTQTVAPLTIFQSPTGKTLIDFGQNLVGRLRLTVSGPAGQTVTLRHAEVLENGELGTRPLRYARATDHYTLRGSQGSAPEVWEPRFTFHGFRYAEVEGWPGELQPSQIEAVVCHSDMERTGWFECSDPLLNRLHENVLWSMRGNFFDIPTDCPQRDERLGWTGDIQVFSPTASFLYDAAGFLSSWLGDLAAEQKATGTVPFVVPTVMPRPTPPAAAWGDAAAVIPWVLYHRFGDRKILSDQFESMCAWVDQIDQIAGEGHLWDQGFQFGDWLDPAAPPERPGDARTPGFMVASAYFARSAEIVGQAAAILGRSADAEHYLKLAGDVRAAFAREYITPAGRLMSDTATAYAAALQFALLQDADQRQHAAQRLVAIVRANRFRISTGFVGTPLICDALTSQGHIVTAYRLLTAQENPSWLYPVTMGATTIWERWDSMLPDGSINPGEMTSFNHYALGAVADWMHRTAAGLTPAEPGYRRLEIRPQPGGGLSYVTARHDTPYGPAACAWRLTGDGQITVEVEVPANTQADVYLPGKGETLSLGSGKYSWTYPYQLSGGAPKKLTLDSPVKDFIDDPKAFQVLITALNQHGTELSNNLLAQEETSLRNAIGFMPWGQGLLDALSQAFADLEQ